MAYDQDDNAKPKNFRHDNEDNHSMGEEVDRDHWLPELEELGDMIASFNKESNHSTLNDKNFPSLNCIKLSNCWCALCFY